MGGFARVALPVAAVIAVPYVGAALQNMAMASRFAAFSAQMGTEGAALMGALEVPSYTASFPWASAALAGVGSLAAERGRQQQLKYQTQVRNAELARQQQELAMQEKLRRDRLRKAVAAERARFGSMGVNSRGGSAAALIRGLSKSAEKDISYGRQSFNLKRRSLLEESQPAKRSGFALVQKTLSPFVNLLEAR